MRVLEDRVEAPPGDDWTWRWLRLMRDRQETPRLVSLLDRAGFFQKDEKEVLQSTTHHGGAKLASLDQRGVEGGEESSVRGIQEEKIRERTR